MDHKEKLVYLAGPISGLSQEEVMGWRLNATEELAREHITTLTPIDVTSSATELQKLAILRDKIDVRRAHVVLMNLRGAKRISIGTMAELGWANAYDKPVVLVMEQDGSNPHEHGFVKTLSTFQVETLEEGIQTVKDLLQGA